jgi:hypothetical protein
MSGKLLYVPLSSLSVHHLPYFFSYQPNPPSVTHTDIQSGVRTFQSLPRQTFGTLQARLNPFYFSTSTILTSTLLLTHLYFHPSLISAPTVKPHWHSSEEGRQGLLIVAGLVPQLLNLIWFGPQATKVMFERHRLEKLEGKEYNEANVCSLTFELEVSRLMIAIRRYGQGQQAIRFLAFRHCRSRSHLAWWSHRSWSRRQHVSRE